MEELLSKLNEIYYSTINKMDIDLSNKEVVFDLSLADSGTVTNHVLKLVSCSSVLWVEKTKDDNSYNYRNCDYYELTAINLRKISATTGDKWLNQYPLEYNVAIEIWETALLIKAEELIIDQQKFPIP